MRQLLWGVLLILLAACGRSEEAFIQKFVEHDCRYALECYDDAVLQYYGWTDEEACIDDHGPVLTSDVQGCAYDKKAARRCLRAMRKRDCYGVDDDPQWPAECQSVFDCGQQVEHDDDDEEDEELED